MPKSAGGLCKNLNKEHSLKINIYFNKWILKKVWLYCIEE